MGKASRRKHGGRDHGTVLLDRLRRGRCLHCGQPRGGWEVWCRVCVHRAKAEGERARMWPTREQQAARRELERTVAARVLAHLNAE